MKTILVTGSSGLVGTSVCEKFAKEGWQVVGVDKYLRSTFLKTDDAETRGEISSLQEDFPNITQYEYDVSDLERISPLIENADAIIHLAGQVSHPRSLEIPLQDAMVNIIGTLNLLELTRKTNSDIPFAYMSSNKVYGDYPNKYRYKIIDDGVFKRYENEDVPAFNETVPIDRCGHTPFGVSKAAADLYTQEYGRNYHMKTATFRGGCLTGARHKAVELNGFLGFFTKQVVLRNKIKIFGGGYRVRDNIHASDVAEAFYLWVNDPKPNGDGTFGKPYNIGGMRENSVSIFETLDAIEHKTGTRPIIADAPERESDHKWWISDMTAFQGDYPTWHGPTKDLDYIFNELLEHWITAYSLNVELQNRDYFKDVRKNTRT
ncbi:MAG: NAD-dependent epimerase/dehydratase family protein [Promethearchaeota archaeon]